jgi:sugar transferase (PEP-CTERM/EpsH1 system associated)
MHVLYVVQRVPYPPNRGDKLAAYHAVRHLARRHRVTVAALAESPEELRHGRALEAELVGTAGRVVAVRHFPAAARAQALTALASGESLSVAYYRSAALRMAIRRLTAVAPVDVAVAFSSSMGPYVEDTGAPLIADFVDLDSCKWELYAAHRAWPHSWLYATEARRLREHERRLSRRAYCTLVRTASEREDCERLIPGARFDVLANGVDLDYFRPRPGAGWNRDIVFTGVMDYFPNVQAVEHFCVRIFPRVRAAVPDASFTVVGARPSGRVRVLAAHPGVRITGQVPDVRPYLADAALVVAPLLIARGVQNKVLEAMAMARPVVATAGVARGVGAPPGAGLVVADRPEEFAARIVELLRDPLAATAMGVRGRRFVEETCVWDDRLHHLETLVEEARAARTAPRSAIGQAASVVHARATGVTT